MYMRKILSRILMGCYVMAAILFVGACNDDVDIQQSYPFSIETMPVPKKLKVGETAEIRCRMTYTRFRAKYSGFIILPHQPTNRR